MSGVSSTNLNRKSQSGISDLRTDGSIIAEKSEEILNPNQLPNTTGLAEAKQIVARDSLLSGCRLRASYNCHCGDNWDRLNKMTRL
jgi:hypothetical protein